MLSKNVQNDEVSGEFLFGNPAAFAISGKYWMNPPSQYLFGELFFVCAGELIGEEVPSILKASQLRLKTIMYNYSYTAAETLCKRGVGELTTLMHHVYEEDEYELIDSVDADQWSNLFITSNLCESLDGSCILLLATNEGDHLFFGAHKAKQLRHILLPPGEAFKIFREYVEFVDKITPAGI